MLSLQFKPALDELARGGMYIGTSSWKYPGWCGQIYDEQRYLTRGKLSVAKFERECLAESRRHFRPSAWMPATTISRVKNGLADCARRCRIISRFGFKVTDEITVKKFPNLPRFGSRAGTANPNFLNSELFERQFMNPLEPQRQKIGPLILEFSTFHKADFEHSRDFVAAMDQFLGALPKGWD